MMQDWNGTVKVSWRIGVLFAIVTTIVGGSFWAGRFTNRVDDMSSTLVNLKGYSQTMGKKVDLLRERQVADEVGDISVKYRLDTIDTALTRIEDLLRQRYLQLEFKDRGSSE